MDEACSILKFPESKQALTFVASALNNPTAGDRH